MCYSETNKFGVNKTLAITSLLTAASFIGLAYATNVSLYMALFLIFLNCFFSEGTIISLATNMVLVVPELPQLFSSLYCCVALIGYAISITVTNPIWDMGGLWLIGILCALQMIICVPSAALLECLERKTTKPTKLTNVPEAETVPPTPSLNYRIEVHDSNSIPSTPIVESRRLSTSVDGSSQIGFLLPTVPYVESRRTSLSTSTLEMQRLTTSGRYNITPSSSPNLVPVTPPLEQLTPPLDLGSDSPLVLGSNSPLDLTPSPHQLSDQKHSDLKEIRVLQTSFRNETEEDIEGPGVIFLHNYINAQKKDIQQVHS